MVPYREQLEERTVKYRVTNGLINCRTRKETSQLNTPLSLPPVCWTWTVRFPGQWWRSASPLSPSRPPEGGALDGWVSAGESARREATLCPAAKSKRSWVYRRRTLLTGKHKSRGADRQTERKEGGKGVRSNCCKGMCDRKQCKYCLFLRDKERFACIITTADKTDQVSSIKIHKSRQAFE